MSTLTQNDGFRGAFVGTLAGDALGAPYEMMKDIEVIADYEKRGGLVPFDYQNPFKKESPKLSPMGRPTDDSELTAALAQSLIANNGLNEEDLFNRLRSVVIDHQSVLTAGKTYAGGATLRKMLTPATYAESRALSSEGAYPSNGSLMRSAPMGLYFAAKHLGIVDPDMVRRMSAVTHRNSFAGDCCVAYTIVLASILTGDNPMDAITEARWEIGWDDEIANILENPSAPLGDPSDWQFSGSALLSLRIALWALVTSSSFREGITKVVALGGDTDTNAAITGGLLGAYYGEQGIPSEWREILIGRKVMEHLADEFSIMANESMRKK